MPLTAEDVAARTFTVVRLRDGYDPAEVDAFVADVLADLTQRAASPAEPTSASRVLEHAERVREDLLAEARTEAEALIAHARAERDLLQTEIDTLLAFEQEYRARLRRYLTEQLADLDAGRADSFVPVLDGETS